MLLAPVALLNPAYSDVKLFSASISPTSGTVSTPATYTITVKDSEKNGAGAKMGCVVILIPAGYTSLGTPSSLVTPGSTSWTIDRVDSTITAKADSNADANKVKPSESISFEIMVTNPASAGIYDWTPTTVTGNNNCASDTFGFDDTTSHPTVTIS